MGFPGGSDGKNPPAMQEDPLEEGMATHSDIVAREIPWTEGPVYSLWACKELDTTERLTHTCTYTHTVLYMYV